MKVFLFVLGAIVAAICMRAFVIYLENSSNQEENDMFNPYGYEDEYEDEY